MTRVFSVIRRFWGVALSATLLATMACADAARVSGLQPPTDLNADMIVTDWYDCWSTDAGNTWTCEYRGTTYSDGGGGGSTTPMDGYTPPPGYYQGSEAGGGEGDSFAPSPDPATLWDPQYVPTCGGKLCNHIVGALSNEWKGCPMSIFWSTSSGLHQTSETWNMKLMSKKFDPQAGAMVGYYKGTSIINGFAYSGAYARNTCDVGYMIFRTIHPGKMLL